jgi:hypothetical protein
MPVCWRFALHLAHTSPVGRAEDGAGEGREEGFSVVGEADGMAVGRGVGAGLGAGGAMARLRMLAEAAACQGSDAYTCTEGQVCCWGVPKLFVIVGIVTAPDTVRAIIKFTLSMRIVTVDQSLSFKAFENRFFWLPPSKDSSSPKVSQTPLAQKWTQGRRAPAALLSVPVAVRWMMLRHVVPVAVGYRSKLTVYSAGSDTYPSRLLAKRVNPLGKADVG